MNIEGIDKKPFPQGFLVDLGHIIQEKPSNGLLSTLPPFYGALMGDDIGESLRKMEEAINRVPFFQKMGALPAYYAAYYTKTKDKTYTKLGVALAEGNGEEIYDLVFSLVKVRIEKAKSGKESVWAALSEWIAQELTLARNFVNKSETASDDALALYLAISFKKISAILTSPLWKPLLKLACGNYHLAPNRIKQMISSNIDAFMRILLHVEKSDCIPEHGMLMSEVLFKIVDQFLLHANHTPQYLDFISLVAKKVHGKQDVDKALLKEETLKFIWCITDDLETMEPFAKGLQAAASKIARIPLLKDEKKF